MVAVVIIHRAMRVRERECQNLSMSDFKLSCVLALICQKRSVAESGGESTGLAF